MKYKIPLDIKKAYKQGYLEKPKYIDLMHEVHVGLFDYSDLLKGTDIAKIEITDKGVIATTRKPEMKFICSEFDKRIAPFEIINFDNYEKEYSDFALKFLKNGDTVFDIGANIGYYSIFFGKKFKSAKIYAFEPIPQTFRALKKNIALNNLKNIRAFNFGFDDKKGIVPFYFYKAGSGNASEKILNKAEKNIEVLCKVMKIDDFVKKQNIKKIDFVKCDVEGAELNVFKGAVKTLREQQPVIMAEMLRKWALAFGYHPNETIEFLKKLGYKCFTKLGKNLREFNIMDENTKETNFIFIKS